MSSTIAPTQARSASLLRRRSDYVWQPPRWLAGFAVAIATAVQGFVAWGSLAPVITRDEIGYLGASYLVGTGTSLDLAGAGYMPGIGILLAPVWWFTQNPQVVYPVAIGLCVALALLAIWPLSKLARYAGATPTASVIMAAVVTIAPARTLSSNYVMSESLLLLVTATACVLAVKLSKRPTIATALLFGLSVGGVVLAHGRGVAFAVAAGLWCLLMLWSNVKVALIAGMTALASSVTAYGIYVWTSSQLYANDERVSSTFRSLGERNPSDFLGTLIGQSWYAVAAWPAVVVVGVALLIHRLRLNSPALLIVISIVATMLFATIQLRHGDGSGVPRTDLWVYGRYCDHLWTIVAVMGLAAITRVRWGAVSLSVLGATGVVCTMFLLVTVPQIPAYGYWVDVHVPGITHMLSLSLSVDEKPQPWLLLSVTVVLITALVLAAGAIRAAAVLTLALYFGLLSVSDDLVIVDEDTPNRSYPGYSMFVRDFPENQKIGIDHRFGPNANLIIFGALPRESVWVDIQEIDPGTEVVYGGLVSKPLEASGARLYSPASTQLSSAWVFPGSLYDELEAHGHLAEPPRTPDSPE